MLYPSINEIKTKVDSRYTLVILAAKRARDIVDGKPALVSTEIKRPVSIAAKEINEDMITCKYHEDEPEEIEEELEEGAEEEAVSEEASEAEETEEETEAEDESDASKADAEDLEEIEPVED